MGALGILSVWDIRYREIPESGIWLLGAAGLLLLLLEPGRSVAEKAGELFLLPIACLPGFLALLLGELTWEKVGKGDGWLLVAMGLFLTGGEIYGAFALAICMGSMAGMAMALGQRNQSVEIPLIPFLMAGIVLVTMLKM